MHAQLNPAFDETVDSTKPQRQQKILNQKGTQRRFAHKMTVGEADSEVFCCRFDPTDKYLACGFGDGAVRVYNTTTGKCAFTLCSFVD